MDRPLQMATSRRDLPPAADSNSREQIVEAARELIRRDGFPRLTVEDVRRQAGISRATFYFYFRNMKHLLLATAGSVMEAMYELAGRHYPDQDEFTRVVRANVAYLDVWRRDSAILGEFFALSLVDAEAREIYASYRKRFEERISGRIERLVKQERIAPTDPAMLAATLSSMVEFAAFRFFFTKDDPISNERTFSDLVRVVSESWYRAVYGRSAPAGFDYSEQALEGE